MMNYKDGILSAGVPVGNQGFITQGTSFFVDPVNGNDGFNGKKINKAFKTLTAAYNACTTNKNDVIYYLAGASAISLTAKLTIDKNFVHLIGISSNCVLGGRARIFQAAATTGLTPMVDVTGTGNTFRNIYFYQGVADATSKGCVQVTGTKNCFENCHIYGIGGNDLQDAAGAYSLCLNDADENRFVNCLIGGDTISAGTAANSDVLFDAGASKNNFDDCVFYRRIEHNTNHPLLKMADAGGLSGLTWFRNCTFIYTSVSGAYHGTYIFGLETPTDGITKIVLKNCSAFSGNATTIAWAAATGVIHADMAVTEANAGGGLATDL